MFTVRCFSMVGFPQGSYKGSSRSYKKRALNLPLWSLKRRAGVLKLDNVLEISLDKSRYAVAGYGDEYTDTGHFIITHELKMPWLVKLQAA